MRPALAIVLGLVSGAVAAALIMGAIFAFAPDPITAVPTPSAVTAPSASASVASDVPDSSTTPAGTSASPSGAPSASASAASGASSGDPSSLFHVGEPAPALVIPQVGGGTIDLASLKGKPVWVNFMATWCPPCVDEFPLMNGFATRYADEGLVVLAIDVKEEEGIVAAFAEGLGTTFPLGLDRDGAAALRWDAVALPVHFWIDKDGIIRDGALGGIGPDIMARGLGAILPGVTVTP